DARHAERPGDETHDQKEQGIVKHRILPGSLWCSGRANDSGAHHRVRSGALIRSGERVSLLLMVTRMPPLRYRRWTRAEYEGLVDRGVFTTDDRIELLDGLLVVREPQGDLHAATVAALPVA